MKYFMKFSCVQIFPIAMHLVNLIKWFIVGGFFNIRGNRTDMYECSGKITWTGNFNL